MLKKVFLAAAATLLLAGATMTVQSSPAQALKNGCWQAAKAKYPESFKARSTYRKACRKRHRAYRKAHR